MPGANTYHYLLFNKPHEVLSQFTREAGRQSLRDFGPFPKNVYPVGRLDADSEGLLFLTDDNRVKHALTDPRVGHPRTYLVQVEGVPGRSAIERLQNGVMIEERKTKQATVRMLATDPDVPPRPVPIRYRKNVPTAWLEITLREGRNRQVRKMTAAVGHPTLRLIRTHIGPLSVRNVAPGEYRVLSQEEIEMLQRIVGRSGEKRKGPRLSRRGT
jgi:23S rRNA pseudouridine2457 synthase